MAPHSCIVVTCVNPFLTPRRVEGGRAGPLLFVAAGQGATFAEFEMRSDGSEARVDPYGVTDCGAAVAYVRTLWV